jgi:uncharacterized 2Fe-2S/4Fe-4S cluster protein (DUF4445 family)
MIFGIQIKLNNVGIGKKMKEQNDGLLTQEEMNDIWTRLDADGKMKCGQCRIEVAKAQKEKDDVVWEKVRTVLCNYADTVDLTEPVKYYINGRSVEEYIQQMKEVEVKKEVQN